MVPQEPFQPNPIVPVQVELQLIDDQRLPVSVIKSSRLSRVNSASCSSEGPRLHEIMHPAAGSTAQGAGDNKLEAQQQIVRPKVGNRQGSNSDSDVYEEARPTPADGGVDKGSMASSVDEHPQVATSRCSQGGTRRGTTSIGAV